jgi:RecJ-like exonuclease
MDDVPQSMPCPFCHGSGRRSDGSQCDHCGGTGTMPSQHSSLTSEVEAEFSEASKLPASYRSGRHQPYSDRAISPDGEPTAVWKPPNPEDQFS